MDLREINQANKHRHPWELIRAEFILEHVKKIKPNRIIDIGSGDGFTGSVIAQSTQLKILSIDSNFNSEQLRVENHYLSYEEITPNQGDLILLTDVLEHIAEPEIFIQELVRHFGSKTAILITVPCFQSLFSEHDTFLGHYRRYDKRLMMSHLQGLVHVEIFRYFFLIPLILRWIQIKFFSQISKVVGEWKYDRSDLRTRFALALLRLDLSLFSFSGLSLLCVGRFK